MLPTQKTPITLDSAVTVLAASYALGLEGQGESKVLEIPLSGKKVNAWISAASVLKTDEYGLACVDVAPAFWITTDGETAISVDVEFKNDPKCLCLDYGQKERCQRYTFKIKNFDRIGLTSEEADSLRVLLADNLTTFRGKLLAEHDLNLISLSKAQVKETTDRYNEMLDAHKKAAQLSNSDQAAADLLRVLLGQ